MKTAQLLEREKELDKKAAELDARIKKIEAQQTAIEDEKLKALAGGGNYNHPIAGGYQNSLEKKTLAAFGKRSIKDLIQTNIGHKYYKGVDPIYKSVAMSLKENIDVGRYMAQIFHDAPLDKGGRDEKSDKTAAVKNILETPYGEEVLAPMLKAFGTGNAGEGAEWIPTAVSSSFIEEFELERQVAMLIREMPMTTNPFKLTVQTNVTTARIATEGSAITGNNFGTADITFDATKLGEFYPLPEELNEDSAPAILALARTEVAEAQLRAREQVILNGDDSGTHMDADTTAATDARKIAKGLRKLALDNSAGGAIITFNSAVTTAKLDEMRAAMGKFGVNPRDLAYIFSPATYYGAVGLEEVTSVEKFGPQATILNGALTAFRGTPIFISEFVREDTDTTGVNSGVAMDDINGLVYLVNLRRFWVGMRRPIRVRVMMDLPDQDRWLLSSYSRIDFQGHTQSTSETSTVIGVDVTI